MSDPAISFLANAMAILSARMCFSCFATAPLHFEANAWASHRGRTISHYQCEIRRNEDNKVVATVESVVMS